MSAGGGTVLAFSFSGATIATDCGLLVQLTLDGTPTGLSDLVFSDSVQWVYMMLRAVRNYQNNRNLGLENPPTTKQMGCY